jgi:SAM-dependent methyltransferase
MTARRRKEWFDDDAFWQDVSPFLFPETRFVEAVEQVDQAIALTAPAGRAVLDLCCGPGRCAMALAQKGFAVTGVDRTRYFINKAKTRARAAGLEIDWVQADMRDFVRPDAFHLVLSMFTSFGYFQDRREDAGVLQNMLTSLRPGGACLIDVLGKERLAAIFQETVSTRLPNGNLLLQRHEIVDDWTRVKNDWIVVRKGRAKNFAFSHTVYSGQELRWLLEQAGFVDVRLYGSLKGDAYGRSSERLVVVGRKRLEA